jgi:hypothetical protein
MPSTSKLGRSDRRSPAKRAGCTPNTHPPLVCWGYNWRASTRICWAEVIEGLGYVVVAAESQRRARRRHLDEPRSGWTYPEEMFRPFVEVVQATGFVPARQPFHRGAWKSFDGWSPRTRSRILASVRATERLGPPSRRANSTTGGLLPTRARPIGVGLHTKPVRRSARKFRRPLRNDLFERSSSEHDTLRADFVTGTVGSDAHPGVRIVSQPVETAEEVRAPPSVGITWTAEHDRQTAFGCVSVW